MSQSTRTKRQPTWREFWAIGFLAVAGFVFSSYFNAFERFAEWSRAREEWQLDEIATLLIVLTFALGFLAWRRSRQLQGEVHRRELAEKRLREGEDSYKRVVAQVADPVESNTRKLQPASKARWDGIVLFVLGVLGFVIATRVEVFEEFATWIIAHNDQHLSETIVMLTLVAFALIIYSWRRWKELKNEICWREEVENALRKNEERFRQIVDNATDIIFRADLFGRFTYCNPAAVEIMQYSQAELLGCQYLELIKPDCRAEVEKFYQQQVTDRVSTTYLEFPVISRDGVEILIGQSVQLLTEYGHIAGFQAVARDITRQRKEEEALRKLKEYRNLFQLANDPILILDAVDGLVLDVNGKACKTYGLAREQFLGSDLAGISPDPEVVRNWLAHLRGDGKLQEFETVHLRADGALIHLVINPTRIEYQGRKAILSINRDVTERKTVEEERQRLEHQFRQSQKLESVGLLAGGIAHDFNNLLTAINGYSELALRQLEPGTSLSCKLEEIRKAGQRAASLTRQLLAFSRKQMLQPRILDLNSIVSEMDKMLRRLIGENIDLVTLLKPNLGQIKADPGQIEQVIMNLAINARDAMPHGGKLTIETGHIYLGEGYASEHLSIEAGDYVVLNFSDDGIGIDAATQKQIFDPFFTTKEVGKGTGLGLSTVYGIVKQSGGSISVYSEVGKGTTFKLYLPRYDQKPLLEESKTQTAVPHGCETVLLVEDEEIVRELSRQILEDMGYKVLLAGNGEDGLRTFKEFSADIDLLVTDVVMPVMSGRELASNVSLLRPETKVLFMSGYTDDAIVRHGILEQNTSFIQKPFSPDCLALKIREVLDQV